MKIGNVEISSAALLAPLAGITDKAFRQVCRSFGAGYCETEMVSAKALSFSDKKSFELMDIADDEHPCGIQLFGSEPDIIASSAKLAVNAGADIIDINMGCPAPKIANNGSGSALMKNPRLCGEIVYAVKNSVDIPVTVKIRKGFDDEHINAVEVASVCADNGADAVIVHGRTRQQYYSGACDLDIIKAVKNAVSVPVIGNGDICSAKSAQHMYDYTGCDYIMVGRGALGNPWVFREIDEYFCTGKIIAPPTLDEKLDVLSRHISRAVEYKGEYVGMREARKHTAYYLKGFKNAAKLRNLAFSMETLDDLQKLINEIRTSNC